MSALDDVIDNSALARWSHMDDVAGARAELARLRRVEDAYRKDNLRFDGHNKEQWCDRCSKWCKLETVLVHDSDCDVAAHLGLPREKGEGDE